MERLDHRSRRDAYGSRINRTASPWLAQTVPWLSIMVASMLPLLLIATAMPLVPPLGYMFFIAWRLVRPGLLPLWAGFPLGLFDDLFSGQPFGSAIMLWSVTMLAIEILEMRFPWRGFWQDWFTAGLAILTYLLLGMVLSGATPAISPLFAMVPQLVLSVLLFPLIARFAGRLDRFRLMRVRALD